MENNTGLESLSPVLTAKIILEMYICIIAQIISIHAIRLKNIHASGKLNNSPLTLFQVDSGSLALFCLCSPLFFSSLPLLYHGGTAVDFSLIWSFLLDPI